MKVRDLISQEIDIDVYDDVCDALAIAFCGPVELTPEGEAQFSEVMDYDVKLYGDHAVVCVDDDEDRTWRRRLRKAKEFFEAAAGYCHADEYDEWFKEAK